MRSSPPRSQTPRHDTPLPNLLPPPPLPAQGAKSSHAACMKLRREYDELHNTYRSLVDGREGGVCGWGWGL